MGLKIVRHALIALLFSVIPALLDCVANSTWIFDLLFKVDIIQDKSEIATIQEICMWTGAALSSVLIATCIFFDKLRTEQAIKERDHLIKMNKDIFGKALGKILSDGQIDYNIRIFIPKHPNKYAFFEFMADRTKIAKPFWENRKKALQIKNIGLIAEEGATQDLSLSVSPIVQGVVGLCYTKKTILWDDNLIVTNETDYNLTESQISKTKGVRWVIGCPILNDKNKVIAVLSLDGRTPVKVPKIPEDRNTMKEYVTSFSRMLYTSVPQLFRR